MSARIITFSNKKGGSGKTSTVVNLTACLGQKGKRCLLIDTDPQSHATFISGIYPYCEGKGIGSLFKGSNITDLITKVPHGLYDILPSYHKDSLQNLYGKEFVYNDVLNKVKDEYDFIVFDTPPVRDDILTFCLSVSTELIIPTPLQFLAIEGLSQLIGFLYKISETTNTRITLSAIIPTMVDMRTRHANEILKQLENTLSDSIIKRGIRLDIKISEASWAQKPVCLYAPKSKAAYDFNLLAEEILGG